MTDLPTPPMPSPTPLTEVFWQGLEENKVRLQQCDDCSGWVFYPRSNCSHCLSNQLVWHEVSGAGTVYSFTIAHRPTAPQFRGMEPQIIAVVELEQGVRLNTVLVNVEPSAITVGMPVQPYFESSLGEQTLLYFQPSDST